MDSRARTHLSVAALGNENPAMRHDCNGGLTGLLFSFSPKVRYDSLRYGRRERDFPLARIHQPRPSFLFSVSPFLHSHFPSQSQLSRPQTRRQEVCANIGVCVVDEDFRPDALVRMAPTGCPTDGRFVTRCATITTPLALVQFFKPRLDPHRRYKQICVFMRAQYFLDNGQGTIRRSCNQCVESRDLNRI
jgi:hypothetical protein